MKKITDLLKTKMKKITAKLLVVPLFSALSLLSSNASASVVTYETRSITSNSFSDYKAGWVSQTSSITSSLLSNVNGITGANDSYNHLSVNFTVSSSLAGSSVLFQIAPDAGYGGAIYLDNVLISINSSDLWWGGNWNSTSELLIANLTNLSAGNHVLEAYWAEGCCNGSQGGRFSINNQGWQSLAVANVDQLAVPEPATLALLGGALLGLGFTKRKRN